MSHSDVHRELARRGPDKLIGTLLQLRADFDHLRWLITRQANLVDTLIDERSRELDGDLAKLEELLVNMQSSCVRLPRADTTYREAWEVPVITEARPLLTQAAPYDRGDRVFRIRFELDPSGPTWKWRLREQELDTGLRVRWAR